MLMAKETIKKSAPKNFTTISGMDIHVAKKFGVFVFRDFYLSIKKNLSRRCFEVLVYNKIEVDGKCVLVDKEKIEDLESFHNNAIKVIIVPIENK